MRRADSYIRVADATLGDGRATGSVETEALEAKWDLTFADAARALPPPAAGVPLPDARCRRPSSSAPIPTRSSTGSLEVGGERIEVDGWRGMIGHNWGAEHAERWVWVQGAGFEGRSPEDYFDMAVGRIKVAGRTTPWVGNGMLVLDGAEHRLGGFERVPSTEVERGADELPLRAQGQGGEAERPGRAPSARTSSPGSTPTRSAPSTTP